MGLFMGLKAVLIEEMEQHLQLRVSGHTQMRSLTVTALKKGRLIGGPWWLSENKLRLRSGASSTGY